MSADQHMMADDSDSDLSEATANSTNESNFDESLGGGDVEVAKIFENKFHLPKEFCEHSEIFKEFFSLDTWNSLSEEERSRLSNLLPQFPENNEQEREETVQQLFDNSLTRFSLTPLDVFHNNLQDGNYRPDIAHYRKSILKAEEREQRIRECERISELAEKLVSSREKLLRSAYRCPLGSFSQLPQSSPSVPRLSSSSASMRANRRYFQEISKLTEELGLVLSDEETVPEGINIQLTKKQIKLFTDAGNLSPGAEMRIVGTTSGKEKSWDHLAGSSTTDERYKLILQSHRKRKIIEPDHPEMEIEGINLKDIFSRTQLTVNPKKLNAVTTRKSLIVDTSRIKQEPSTHGKFQIGKNVNRRVDQLVKSETPSETDEEDWIKANIIKVEPQSKVAIPTKIKTIFSQQPGQIIVNRKRPSVETTQVRASGKKIIIDAGGLMKSSFVNKTNPKRVVISSRPTVMMDPNDLIEDDGDVESPESRHEVQACFLSLIRDIFCSTRDHRMKLEELRNRINVWLSNPIASVNDWFMQATDWSSLLISAVHFLSGEFQEQPEDFVPYLEFKSSLNIYQWIGAGRDLDTRMTPLCQYWLSRRNEMGVKHKYKTLVKTYVSPEKNEENHLHQAISPPNARCRTEWRVQPANNEDNHEFRLQEKHRYENPHLPFIYRHHGYESVVGPLRGIYSQSPVASKARDHNTLIADRPNFVTILALVRDAAARLPNGEGTRYDICELLKSSQYIIPGTSDNVVQSIVSGALDRMHTESDPCIKYDTKRKLWIYVHRNRSEEDFERLHQQQSINRQKKPVFRKTKLLETQQTSSLPSPIRVVSSQNSTVRTYHTKITATASNPVPALATFEQKLKIQNQSSPPPLKISPKRFVKTIGNERNMEPIDVEASLDAQAFVKSTDSKHRFTFKNVQQMSPIRIVTSSPSYTQSFSGVQSSVNLQSPRINSIVGAKRFTGKPIIVSHNQAPPLVSQSSPNSGQSYLIPINVKQGSEPPALLVPKTTILQHKNVIKLSPSSGKSLISSQQKIILTSTSAKGGKIMTFPKSQSPVTMLSQQKQILTNVIVQQQKTKGQHQIIMNSQQQKIPGLTISSPGGNLGTPQVIQIQQTTADGKMTLSSANLTPQQRQTIFQSLKQFKSGNQQTMIVKPQVVKPGEIPAPPLVNVSGSVGKIMKAGTMVHQPQVIVSMGQKIETNSQPIIARVVSAGGRQLVDGILPKAGTTFKIAGGQNVTGQSNLIQVSASSNSQIAQYTVVAKGKNFISMGNQTKLISTQAHTSSSPSQGIVESTGTMMISNSQSQSHSPMKIVQGGSITAQQLVGAKLINVQALANKGIKTTGGMKMINSQNYQFSSIGGKSMIIANKANTTNNIGNSSQGLVLQTSNTPNGTFILNAQGQQLKVQGNVITQGNIPVSSQPQTVMLGNQIVKVQSLNQIQQKVNSQQNLNESQEGQRPIILGSSIKLMKPQQQRVVLATPGGGQYSQQIILPANFQNLKSLQGLKVIPMGQQGTSDRIFTARVVTSTVNASKSTTPNLEAVKE